MTAQQPLNNLTRVAIQALAAVLGGTQSLHTDAYDEAWAVPSAEAALLALRQQQVIASETGVTNTVDPLGGSWFVESLTNEVERQVWAYLDEIDRFGGMVKAIAAGYPQKEIADAAYRFQREFDDGRARDRRRERLCRSGRGAGDPAARGLRGVDASATSIGWRGRAPSATRTRLRPRWRACATLPRSPGSSEANVMPALIECANAYATLGEMCGVFRAVFGEYREPVAV